MPKRSTTEEFVEKAKRIHGNKYDYSFVEYVRSCDKVKIVCRIHGVFEQKPNHHLGGRGCVKCTNVLIGNKFRKTHDFFIKKSIRIHGNRYDYSKSYYKKCNEYIIITCKEHGDFKQFPSCHLIGQGCPECGKKEVSSKLRISNSDFIKKAKEIHGDKYDYRLVDYKGSRYKVKIICPYHGVFIKRALNHMQGQGCPKCSNFLKSHDNNNCWDYKSWDKASKVSKNFDSFKVYIIRCWNDEEEFYKVGKTYTTLKIRFRYKKDLPYNYSVVNIFEFKNAMEASKRENLIKNNNKKYKYIPKIKFGGMYECFTSINLTNETN